jgi:hypothetical protein
MLVQQDIPIGQNLNGAPGQGEVLLSQIVDDDTQRAELLSVSIQSGEVQTSLYVRLARGLAEAVAAGGPHIQLGIIENDTGYNAACCRCIVPRGWNLYAFTTGPTATIKTLIVDWRRVTLKGEV